MVIMKKIILIAAVAVAGCTNHHSSPLVKEFYVLETKRPPVPITTPSGQIRIIDDVDVVRIDESDELRILKVNEFKDGNRTIEQRIHIRNGQEQ